MSKILCICDSMLPPDILTSGANSIYLLERALATDRSLHVLTAQTKYSDPAWKQWVIQIEKSHGVCFHVISGRLFRFERTWKILTRLLYLVWALILHRRHQFELIHVYSSSFWMVNVSGLIKRWTKALVLHTLCTCRTQRRSLPFLFRPDEVICTTRQMLQNLRGKASLLPIPIASHFFDEHKPLQWASKKSGEIAIAYV